MTNEGAKREIEAEWERMNDDEEWGKTRRAERPTERQSEEIERRDKEDHSEP